MVRKGLSLIATLTTVGALALLAPSRANAAPILQPGSSITDQNGYCTLNWIYDGTGAQAGKVFGGAAAHCSRRVRAYGSPT